MVFQVSGGDGFASGGDVALDATEGFLVELLRAFRSDGAIESQMQCLPRAVSDLRRSRHEAVVFHDCW